MHGVVYVIRTPVAYKCNNYKQQSNIDTCFSSIHGYMEDKGIHAYGDEELSSKGKLRLFWPWQKGGSEYNGSKIFSITRNPNKIFGAHEKDFRAF
jgi:hypothetical protein